MPVMDGMEATRLIRSFEESCQAASTNNISSSQHDATVATSASNDGVYDRRRIPVPIIAVRRLRHMFSIFSRDVSIFLNVLTGLSLTHFP